MKKYLLLVVAAMLMVLAACSEKEEVITMGFIPSQEADKIADTVKPLEEKLSEILGVTVKAEVMVDFTGLVEGMRTGQIDIGFLNPFGFVQAEERAGVEVILKSVRNGSDSYVAQYAVPADSDIQTVEDLVEAQGLVWSYADTLSTSGFLFPAAHLMGLGIENLDDHFTQIVVGGHDNAILALLDGTADFATTFDDARTRLESEYPTIMEDIRIIGYTNPIPNDTISVRGDMSDELKEAIRNAFLAFNEDEDMMTVMYEVYTWDGIAPAASEDYDVVRDVFELFKDQLSQ